MLESIGINYKSLGIQIVNFVLFIWILKKFLYQPILTVIANRRREIREGLELKEKMEGKVGELDKKREEVLQEAREEVQLLIEQKKKEAEKIKAKIVKEARAEKEEIVQQGTKETEAKRQQMEKRMKKESVELAAVMAEKVLSNLLSADMHHKIIQKQLDKLAGSKLKA